MKIGIITYDYVHLKTEQILETLILRGFNIKVYTLPFKLRKERNVFFNHRPNQTVSVNVGTIIDKNKLEYVKCKKDTEIDNECDLYIITGAGILSKECVRNKKIINCHPGIIPNSRGLDSFKWAILERKPLGVTLHYIDENIDSGDIISIIPTNVYKTDSLETLSRRHYENEIMTLLRFDFYLENKINKFKNIKSEIPRMRMNISDEVKMCRNFDKYIDIYG